MPGRRRVRRPAAVLLLAGLGVFQAAASVPGDQHRLTLADALASTLAHPSVLAARESIAQARAERQTASLLPNPTLSSEAALLPLGKRYTPEEPGGPPEVSAGVSYPVDWLLFGKRAAAIDSADAEVRAAEADYEDVVRRRTAETATAFFAALEAEALETAAGQAAGDLAQIEAAIQKAVASGGRPAVELSRVRLELQSARRDERSAHAAAASAKARLWSLLSTEGPPSDSLVLAETLDAAPMVRPMAVDAAFALAGENRPDVRMLRHRAAKARADEVVELRNGRPETSLNLGFARQFQRSIGAPNVNAWGVSIDLALPIFDRNQGNRVRARSAAVQAEHEVAAGLTTLRAEVEEAVQTLNAAFENASDIGHTSLDLAVQVRDSFRKAYEAGGRPLVEMLDAQRSYRETYQAYVQSRADYRRALAQYEAVLGKRMTP